MVGAIRGGIQELHASTHADSTTNAHGRIEPNAMQRDALANIRKLREEGERKAVVISATGTGKTYLPP